MAKDCWDKTLIVSEIFGKIAVPVLIAILGFLVNDSIQKQEQQRKIMEQERATIQKEHELKQANLQHKLILNQKYIEIAVSILNAEPSKVKLPLREWAINTIDKYSEIKFTKTDRKILMEQPLVLVIDSLTSTPTIENITLIPHSEKKK